MICKNCNQIIDDDAKFCPNCGMPQNTEAKQQHLTQEQLVQQAGQQQSAQGQPTQEQPMQQEPSQVSQQPSQATQQPYTQQSPPPGDGQAYYYQQENQDQGYQSDNSTQYNSSPYNSSGHNEEMINSTPYIIFAIITTILCCLPLGIPAIMFAAKINSAQRAGSIDVAKIYARKAKMFTICSAALGVVLWTCFIGILVIGSVASYYQY